MSGRPLISIILPVHDVEDYLGDCLQSVLGQPYADIEVIAVDAGSTDSSGQILDHRAGQDARLTPWHLGHVGPGPARNAGLRCATGDYVWFVDADDLLAPGSLAAVADRLPPVPADCAPCDCDCLSARGRA